MLCGIHHDQKNKKEPFRTAFLSLLFSVFGRTWGITVNNDTLLPPLANTWKVCHLKLLFL